MSISTIRFNKQDRPGFYKELRKKVNAYFKENGKAKTANTRMKVKTAFMLLLYTLPLVLLLSGVIGSLLIMFLMWGLMGLGMVGIGTSIMHDANHGSYSKKQGVNKTLGYLVNLVGGYHVNWKIQHNVLHHTFTNVEGFDEDIENAMFRFSPNADRKRIYRFQAFYAPILYGIMTLYWLLGKDPIQLKGYADRDLLKTQGRNLWTALTEMSLNKVAYLGLTLLLPMLLLPFPWWQTLLGFLSMHFIAGLFLSLIFQPAHVITDVDFYVPDSKGGIENDWAVHQFKTTANFARGSKAFSWFIGGLDQQVEHHLFPNICHVHYRKIAPIVKEIAKNYEVPYYEHKTFFGAIGGHFRMLHSLGKGSFTYDLKLDTS
ncbi:MAG: fatty acid desaturase [Flavobacteriales bacterium]